MTSVLIIANHDLADRLQDLLGAACRERETNLFACEDIQTWQWAEEEVPSLLVTEVDRFSQVYAYAMLNDVALWVVGRMGEMRSVRLFTSGADLEGMPWELRDFLDESRSDQLLPTDSS